jgi:hypothetical protein
MVDWVLTSLLILFVVGVMALLLSAVVGLWTAIQSHKKRTDHKEHL